MRQLLPPIAKLLRLGAFGLGLTTLIALGAVAVIGALLVRSLTFYSTPTCISYEFSSVGIDRASFLRLVSDASTSHGLRVDLKRVNAGVWMSNETRVSLTLHETNPGAYLSVCSLVDTAERLAAVTAMLQKQLPANSVVKTVALQRNNKLYRFAPTCVQEIDYPVDFEKLSQGLLHAKRQNVT